jgi:cell division protein FtsB
MRIKRSVRRFFGALIVPALSAAALCYFGGYAIWGDRGALALEGVQAKLGIQQERLAQLESDRHHLQKRIALMRPGSVDPDMVEELARGELLDGGPGQVAVSRTAH